MNTNPVMMLANLARSGGNPMYLLQQMAQQSNPQAAQVMRLMSGKTPQQTRSMVEQMCRERGTSMEEMARSLGLPMR